MPLQGVSATGEAASFTHSAEPGKPKINGEAPDVFVAEATVGGESSLKADAQVIHPPHVLDADNVAVGIGAAIGRGAADDRRRDAGFIDEDQPLQIKPWLLLLQEIGREHV